MLLTITSTTPPATDLGYLLHKNPARLHERELPFGTARVCYPEAGVDRCTAALVVEVDPVKLVRNRKRRHRAPAVSLDHYVNDRPYAASSFLSVALGKVFGTALSGRSAERPDLAARALPLAARLPVVPCTGGPELVRRLFAPLGYELEARPLPLDPAFPEWGASRYVDLRLQGTVRLQELLEHLAVLLPVLDDDKHYWVGPDEVDNLLRRGESWLGRHPERELIARRALRHDRDLAGEALRRLVEADGGTGGRGDPDGDRATGDAEVEAERPLGLAAMRLAAVVATLRAAGARRVVDLGCGEGGLVGALLQEPWVDRVVGVDVAARALVAAARRLRLQELSPRQRDRVSLLHGSLTYRDQRIRGFDAATVVEVVEHVDPSRLGAFERAVFAEARPATVVLTTPNADYNLLFAGLPAGELRHPDHRFEWSRDELAAWARGVGERHGYRVVLSGIGPEDADRGAPTQMAVFSR